MVQSAGQRRIGRTRAVPKRCAAQRALLVLAALARFSHAGVATTRRRAVHRTARRNTSAETTE
ncbi:hypothetical protein BO443_70197 [Burkholderia orbicola]